MDMLFFDLSFSFCNRKYSTPDHLVKLKNAKSFLF